jgi:hypothetical protein
MMYLLFISLFYCTINTADPQAQNPSIPAGNLTAAKSGIETAGFSRHNSGDTALVQQIEDDFFRVDVTHNGIHYTWYTDKKDLWKTIKTKFRTVPLQKPLTKKDISILWHGMARDIRYLQDPSFRRIVNRWQDMATKEPITKHLWEKSAIGFATYSPEWKKFRHALTCPQILRILNIYTTYNAQNVAKIDNYGTLGI